MNGPEEPGPGVSCYQYLQTQLSSEDEDDTVVIARTMTLGDSCSDVLPHREKYRKHGLINIYLTKVRIMSNKTVYLTCVVQNFPLISMAFHLGTEGGII